MMRVLLLAAFLQCTISQQYQQKVAPGVPPQSYQNYQQPPPPPPPQQQQYQQQQQFQQQQQYQQPPQQQQQYQQPPPQQVNIPVPQQHGGHGDPQLLNPANIAHEREHIQEHLDVPIDTSKMSEQELQFHYFKMHDADNNNKLDGCELIKSLIHWHDEPKEVISYIDELEASVYIDKLMSKADLNNDGYITFPEWAYKYRHTELESIQMSNGEIDKNHPVYSDQQIEQVLEHALNHTDMNRDGFIDYLEYRNSEFKAKKAQQKNKVNVANNIQKTA